MTKKTETLRQKQRRFEVTQETLRQKQSRFTSMVARLILHAEALGYDVTLGECWRHPTATHSHAFEALQESLHKSRLAVDLNLFRNGRYLRSTQAHEPLGLYWESLGGSWGGSFGDVNHYSLEHNGVK